MKKYILIVPKIVLCTVLMACGAPTSIQTGEVGKQLDNNGLEKIIRKPSTFRLPWCFTEACPKLVRLQVNKSTADLEIARLFLPKSNVDVANVKIGLQFRVKENEASIDQVFEEVRPKQAEGQSGESDRVLLITAEDVYDTYLKRKAPDAIVSCLREYTVDQVLSSVPEISEHTKDKINEMLKDAPIEVTELGFPNGIGEIPEQVSIAKQALYALEENQARQIKQLQLQLAIVDMQQAVARVRLQKDMENANLAGINYSEYVMLQTFQRFADAAENGTSIALGNFMPQTNSSK